MITKKEYDFYKLPSRVCYGRSGDLSSSSIGGSAALGPREMFKVRAVALVRGEREA